MAGDAPVTDRVVKVGLVLPMFSGDPDKVLAAARDAEALGFDGVFGFDHFFPPGQAPDRPALEAFTTLASVAAATERVRLGTLVTRAILRPPGLVAKMAATIDEISGGRMILGLGTGDPIDRPEHEAFGFPNLSVPERRVHLAEATAAVKALFGGAVYPGGTMIPRLEGPLLPPPIQPGGPPVWLGAMADDVVRMAGRIADGWNGWGLPADRFALKARLLSEEATAAGRSAEATWAGIVLVGEDDLDAARLLEERERKGMSDSTSWHGSAERFVAFLRDLAAAGATWAIMVLAGPAGRRELVAERVLPALTS
jgi:alkanesulfonate monooxygenase SsuD/methylene tetrahydromethanopterin reductase-like flavin-dependent oxidoreductase (luciferase family)